MLFIDEIRIQHAFQTFNNKVLNQFNKLNVLFVSMEIINTQQ